MERVVYGLSESERGDVREEGEEEGRFGWCGRGRGWGWVAYAWEEGGVGEGGEGEARRLAGCAADER